MLCSTTSPSSCCFLAAGSASQAARRSANSVSPPPIGPGDGTSRAESSEHFAGTRLNELSVCQSWLPRLNRLRRSRCAGVIRIDLERAKAATEGELLLIGYRLLREDEDAVAVESRLDLGEDFGRHRAAQVDAPHFGAESWVKRAHLDRHVAPHSGTTPII